MIFFLIKQKLEDWDWGCYLQVPKQCFCVLLIPLLRKFGSFIIIGKL